MTAVVAIQPAMTHSGLPAPPSRPHSSQLVNGRQSQHPSKPASSPSAANNARGRRERPCDACRRRKSRCVIHEGAVLCVLCEFHRQASPTTFEPSIDLDSSSTRGSQTPNIRPAPSPVARPFDSSRASAEPGETLGLQRRKYSRYLGLTAPFDNTIWGLSHFDTRHESNIDLGTLRKVNEHECFIMLNDEAQDYDDAETLQAIDDVVAPHGDALVDIYFRIVHPNFPIVQRRIFYDRLSRGDRAWSPPLLAGMYILALNWWSHDPRLASLPKPDSEKLDAIASRALAAAMQRPKLSTVQGGLLLLQRPGADSWSLTTQLVAIGQELGLHLDCSSWSIPNWERGLRRRIAWALYMQDKWSSLIHGRPSHIFGANWAVKAIEDLDFDESESTPALGDPMTDNGRADAERGQVLFGQMIALTGIMAEVTDTFYTQIALQEFSNAGRGSTKLILDKAKPVQMRLKSWFSNLPAIVKMDNYQPGRLSATGYLHLAYFATEITLHRRIVQSLEPDTADAYMMYICRSAAKTRLISAMDFVNRLKPEHLQSFWHFAAKINFTLIGTFGSLLWATAPTKEEAMFYKNRLEEYRWTLSVSSKRADFLDYAVQMLDASRAMLNNLADKPSVTQGQISTAGVPDQQATSAPLRMMQMEDQQMDDAAVELRRFPSGSAFSGFSNEHLDQYGNVEPGMHMDTRSDQS